ncbi:intraflagellar transport 54 [Haematobia irritans]|uniref:intraflagellar transport 54 n=1 Tax=Haematobia irritans TaxID=7368 RepID=UPI003F4F9847
MAEDINPAVIKHTQETLGKYVKKPHLTEKLLKKPPFRFLHDVFAVVIRDTGCFEGLYTPDELNSDNIKDRDDKMRFLQKMIDVVRICTNVPMTVKTSKIVAGHEAEKTNELLQLMGKIIENKLNWQPAVEQVLKGKELKPPGEKAKEKPKDKEALKTKDPNTKTKKDPNKISKQASVTKDDKIKKPKEREKSITPNAAKDKGSSSKPSAKLEDKATKKSKEPSANKKLSKADSQSSNKSISPNKELKRSAKIKEKSTPTPEAVQCAHDDETKLQSMEPKRKNSMTQNPLINSKTNEELFGPTPAQEEKMEQVLFGDGKIVGSPSNSPKQRPGSRKSSGKSKNPQKEQAMELKLENREEKVGTLKNEAMEQSAIDDPKNKPSSGEKKNQKDFESNEKDIALYHKETPKQELTEISSSQKNLESSPKLEDLQPLPVAIAAGIVKNDVKRESTFTRENSQDLPNKVNRPRTSLRPPSARPPSARPGAPRRRDRNVEIILQPNDQIKMSGIQVKLENFGDLDDDGENLVIIENTSDTVNGGLTQDIDETMKLNENSVSESMEQQGHLVQQILETQKELTQQKDITQQIKNDKDSANGMVMKQTSMNNLRDVIQGLTKSVNPLGKLMDFIPEDIDAMQLEFTMWRDTYTQASNQLKREKSLTESATEPMKNQLLQIESSIQEYMEMIDASRVKILQNNDKILKMLTNA